MAELRVASPADLEPPKRLGFGFGLYRVRVRVRIKVRSAVGLVWADVQG